MQAKSNLLYKLFFAQTSNGVNLFIKKPFGSAQGKKNFFWQKIISGTIILAAVILFLNLYQAEIKNYFYSISYPLTKIFWKAGDGSSDALESFFKFRNLAKENNNLKQENQKLLEQISFLEGEVLKNQAISNVVINTKKDSFTMVLARIVGLDSANDILLIDRGQDDGVVVNMPIISSEKVLYGRVSSVYKNFSRVTLISNKNSVLDIKISPAPAQRQEAELAPIYGAVKGSGNLSLYLDLISSDVQINKGDILVSSALEGMFPKDLLVGKIISTNQNDIKPFQTAKVQPFFDIKNIENLFVITNYLRE